MPMMFRCHAYGKKNIEGPPSWETNDQLPWYDPKGKYGAEIPGAIANGYTADEIKRYFDLISEFASYSFNRSHSACYGYLAWLTAWLKRHYTAQFMSNTISMADMEDKGKYMNICRAQFGIRFIPPDVNISEADFTPYDKYTIYYGLGAIKGVGMTAVSEILTVRQNSLFTSLADFLVRVNRRVVNAKIVVALIKAGCFDYFEENRYKLIQDYYIMMNPKEKDFAKVADKVPDPEKWSIEIRNSMEEELLGTRVTNPSWIDCLATGKKIPENTSLEKTLIPKKDREGFIQYDQHKQIKYMPYAPAEVIAVLKRGQYYQYLRLKTDGIEYTASDPIGYWTGDHTYFPDPTAHSGVVMEGAKIWIRGIKQDNGMIKITSIRGYKEADNDDKPEDG